jgi:hypothetical protein
VLLQELLELARLMHWKQNETCDVYSLEMTLTAKYNVASANKLSVNVELGDSRPLPIQNASAEASVRVRG